MSKFTAMDIQDPVIIVRPYLKNRSAAVELCCNICTEERPAGDYRHGRRICQACYNKKQNESRRDKAIRLKFNQDPEGYIEALNFKISIVNQSILAY